MTHLDEDELAALLSGTAGGAELERIEEHLDTCDDCRRLAVAVGRAIAPAVDLPAPGDLVGRYRVLDRLGAGAMGVVLGAWDPALDRRVAIKILHPDLGIEPSEGARERLLREAKALARLQHPNVVAVHDVGMWNGSRFVAMEFVRGRTLSAWLAERPRRQRAIVAIFAEAAGALAAAHRAGIVHRDFKPSNVLVDDTERVRVMDFGLARTASEPASEVRPVGGLDGTATQTGAMVGTPAYMSPEQLAGAGADARSDQYSFFVALHEALYGRRPATPDERLPVRAASGEFLSLPLRSAISRGLERDPDRRHPDMEAVARELSRDPLRLRRRVAGAVAVAVFGIAAAVALPILSRPVATCERAAERLEELWNPTSRQALGAGLRRNGTLPEAAAAGIEEWIDAWAAAWRRAVVGACEDTWVRGEQSEEMLDRRVYCLDRRRTELSAFLGFVAKEGGTERTGPALWESLRIADIERCSDRELLARNELPLKGSVAVAVEAARRRLIELGIEAQLGADRTAELESIVQEANELDYAPLLAEASFALARAHAYQGGGESAYMNALRAAEAAEDDARRVEILIELAVDSIDRGELGKARDRLELARAGIARVSDPYLEQLWTYTWSMMLWVGGAEYTEVIAGFRAASAPGGSPWMRAQALETLGDALVPINDIDGAEAAYREAYEMRSVTAGTDALPTLVTQLGQVMVLLGRHRNDEAETLARALLAKIEERAGTEVPVWADSALFLSSALSQNGKVEEAVRLAERAVEVRRKIEGGELLEAYAHEQIAWMLVRKDPVRALREARLARDSYATLLGPDHEATWIAEITVGEALLEAGRVAEAQRTLADVLARAAGSGRLRAQQAPRAYLAGGRTELVRKRSDEAVRLLRKARELERSLPFPEAARLADIEESLGDAFAAAGNTADARASYLRAAGLRRGWDLAGASRLDALATDVR